MRFDFSKRIRDQLSERQQSLDSQAHRAPRVFYCRKLRRGLRERGSASATGLHAEECVQERYYWTDGHAVITCSLPRHQKIRWLWIELGAGCKATPVTVTVNGRPVRSGKISGRRRLRLRLPQATPSQKFVVEVQSATFTPADCIAGSRDTRVLGVMLGDISFAKHWWRYSRAA